MLTVCSIKFSLWFICLFVWRRVASIYLTWIKGKPRNIEAEFNSAINIHIGEQCVKILFLFDPHQLSHSISLFLSLISPFFSFSHELTHPFSLPSSLIFMGKCNTKISSVVKSHYSSFLFRDMKLFVFSYNIFDIS